MSRACNVVFAAESRTVTASIFVNLLYSTSQAEQSYPSMAIGNDEIEVRVTPIKGLPRQYSIFEAGNIEGCIVSIIVAVY